MPSSAAYDDVHDDQQPLNDDDATPDPAPADPSQKKKKTAKRRKVNHACLYCRRSHMTCDEGRPCQRCIKREIGHMCHDEHRTRGDSQPRQAEPQRAFSATYATPGGTWPLSGVPQQQPYLYQPETLGNEFNVLSDFLETLDDGSFFTPPPPALLPHPFAAPHAARALASGATTPAADVDPPPRAPDAPSAILPAATKTERFLLTAADQEPGPRDERLNRVIRSKYEAGLLKPYNYVKGYARLSRWMDRNVSQESKQQILQPLSVLRPKFRAVAQSLKDIDLVFIEEAFERLLLDYDRVFSAMGVPACLWRRTGEIYKGNREFTELVGVDGYLMRDGRLCIYELMAEESAVNYWEKYGNVAFDSTQKAVLTSCVLRYKPQLGLTAAPTAAPTPAAANKDGKPAAPAPAPTQGEEGFINCCFSFTIRRDKWGIPSMIVGNFIKC